MADPQRQVSQQAPGAQPVGLRPSGPPETVLDPPPAELVDALKAAQTAEPAQQLTAIEQVVARWPRASVAWAALGDAAPTTVVAYAAYRVGYHRGLDQLRGSGWKGSGYVRWEHVGNRGFLRCVMGLAKAAGAIGETDEHERCTIFLAQLDPSFTGGTTPPAQGG